MTKNKSKLHTALIETGKEAETIKEAHYISDMVMQLHLLKSAYAGGNMKAMRQAARRLAALAIKFMIDKL